jgi:hypothetical protein
MPDWHEGTSRNTPMVPLGSTPLSLSFLLPRDRGRGLEHACFCAFHAVGSNQFVNFDFDFFLLDFLG